MLLGACRTKAVLIRDSNLLKALNSTPTMLVHVVKYEVVAVIVRSSIQSSTNLNIVLMLPRLGG